MPYRSRRLREVAGQEEAEPVEQDGADDMAAGEGGCVDVGQRAGDVVEGVVGPGTLDDDAAQSFVEQAADGQAQEGQRREPGARYGAQRQSDEPDDDGAFGAGQEFDGVQERGESG